MNTNKYIITGIMILIALSLLSCMATSFIDSKVILIIGTSIGFAGLTALASLAAFWSRTMMSLNIIVDKLKKNDPENIRVTPSPMITPLMEAITKYSTDSISKEKELQKQSREFNLQVQLLEKEQKNTEAILYSINDAVLVVDSMDRVVLANSAAESLFDVDMEKVYLQPIKDVISDKEFVESVLQTRQKELRHVKHEISLEDDEMGRTFDSITSCVNDEKDGITGVVAILHDISKEKEISRMKNDFVSHVSHELKTPLASINAYAEMLVDGEAEDQETVKEFCTIIQSQAQRLNRLIEEILNISRIESGLIKVHKEQFSVAMQIKEAASMIESYAKEKSIQVNTQAPIIFDQVVADKDMISQVIINLLSNAVKYTCEGGSITVESEVDEADSVVRVTVQDTGVGIPPEAVDHVFDKFYRVEANKKYAKGTGLGLNLVQQIIEKVHEGRVFVSSVQGEGSTFGFELPVAASANAKKAVDKTEDDPVEKARQ